jgi:hypothetical protein
MTKIGDLPSPSGNSGFPSTWVLLAQGFVRRDDRLFGLRQPVSFDHAFEATKPAPERNPAGTAVTGTVSANKSSVQSRTEPSFPEICRVLAGSWSHSADLPDGLRG